MPVGLNVLESLVQAENCCQIILFFCCIACIVNSISLVIIIIIKYVHAVTELNKIVDEGNPIQSRFIMIGEVDYESLPYACVQKSTLSKIKIIYYII